MNSQKEICPAGYFAGLEGGKHHWATRQELQNNGGVCKKCRKEFEKRHKKAISGDDKRLSEIDHHVRRNWDEEGNNADIRIEGSYEAFNYEALEEQDERQTAKDFATRAITKFALRLLERGDTPKRLFTTVNAICFAAQIHPQQEKTQRWFSEKLKMSLANFSLEVNHWRDLFNLPAVGGAKGKDKREKSRLAARLTHEKKGNEMRSGTLTDHLFQSVNRAVEQANKNDARIRCMTPERRQELIDRLKPLCDLKTRLERSSTQGQAFKTPP